MVSEKRLIDANAVIKEIDNYYHNSPFPHPGTTWLRGLELAVGLLLREPTVDAVEVVHGRWEKSPYFYGYVRCSVCHDCNVDDLWIDGKKWKYCPNCGAKMDGERKDNG